MDYNEGKYTKIFVKPSYGGNMMNELIQNIMDNIDKKGVQRDCKKLFAFCAIQRSQMRFRTATVQMKLVVVRHLHFVVNGKG